MRVPAPVRRDRLGIYPADSWHSRPIFYSGGGAGYSGRPERGDTLYLYFPTEREEAHSVIGGGGAGYEVLHTVTQQIMDDTAAEEEEAEKSQSLPLGVENQELPGTEQGIGSSHQGTAAGKTQKADASNMTGYKNWSTPGKQGVSLNPAGIRLQTGGGSAMGMGSGGTSLSSWGDIGLTGKNGIEVDMLLGKKVSLKANEYLCLQCGMSAAVLLPEEIHLKGIQVQLDQPENKTEEILLSDSRVEMLREAYYNDKWGSPLQLFMPDGTVIGRVKGLEDNAALRKYFWENVLNTEGYVNYLDNPELAKSNEYSIPDPVMKAEVERELYLKWLSATYGKTKMEKVGDWLVTKEGRHAVLDAIGIFLEPADGVNAVLYMLEGDWKNAGLSGISMIPLIGDYLGKGGKGAKYALKLADLTKLNRNKKVIKVVEKLDIFMKARKADMSEVRRLLRESWENLVDGRRYAEQYVTTEGIIYWVEKSDDFRTNIKLMDEAGDMLGETWQTGKKAEAAGEFVGDAGKAVGRGSKISPSKPYDINAMPKGLKTKITSKMDEATQRSLLRENEAAETLAKNGYEVEQNPIVKGTNRNPDYIIEGEIFDCYAPSKNKSVRGIASTI